MDITARFSQTILKKRKIEVGIYYFRIISPHGINKTKYFRLRLSDDVGTERPETDLRLT